MGTFAEKVTIKIGGKEYDNYFFLNIALRQELLRPNELTFTMQDKKVIDSMDTTNFPVPRELMGKNVELTIVTKRFDNNDLIEKNTESIHFKGIIFNVNVYSDTNLYSEQLIDVTAYSSDYLLADHPNCFMFENRTLKEIVTDTIIPYKIDNDISPRMTEAIPYTVQYNESDHCFLSRLAQRYGEWMFHDGEKWIFGGIDIVKKEVVPLKVRNDIQNYRFNARLMHHNIMHAHHDYMSYENPKKTNFIVSDHAAPYDDELTDEAVQKSALNFKKTTFQHLRCSNPEGDGLEPNPVDELQTSLEVKLLGEKTQQVVCTGSSVRADLTIGSCIEILDCYKVDNPCKSYGDLMIIGITHHTQEHGEYRNTFTAVPSKCKYPPYYQSDLFPVSSAQRALVVDNNDPKKLGRIRVQFLWQEEQNPVMMTPWIRIAQPHGGNNKGFYFIPEIGEEVMVDFENGNLEKPYVVGTLYHGKQNPDEEKWFPTDTNEVKMIRSRNGHSILFRDRGDGGYLALYDKPNPDYAACVILDSDEKLLYLESKGNIELFAHGNIMMSAGGNITSYAGNNIVEDCKNDMKITVGGEKLVNVEGTCETLAKGNLGMGSNSRALLLGDVSTRVFSYGISAVNAPEVSIKGKDEVNIESEIINIKGDVVNIN